MYGTELSDTGVALGRLTGIALLVLMLAIWPTPAATKDPASSVRAPFIYNLLTTIYFIYVGIGVQLIGILLWPAVAVHAIVSFVLGRAWLSNTK